MATYTGTWVNQTLQHFALETDDVVAAITFADGDVLVGTMGAHPLNGSTANFATTIYPVGGSPGAPSGGYVMTEGTTSPYLTADDPFLAPGNVVTTTVNTTGSRLQNATLVAVALELVEAEANESIDYTENTSVVVSKAETTESILPPHYDSGNVDRQLVPTLSVAKAETNESILPPHYDSGNVDRLNVPTFVFAMAETNESIAVLPAFYLIGAATTKYLRSPIIGII